MRIKLVVGLLLFGAMARAVNVDLVIPDTGRHIEVNLDGVAEFIASTTFQQQIDALAAGEPYYIAVAMINTGAFRAYDAQTAQNMWRRKQNFREPELGGVVTSLYFYRRNVDGSFAIDREFSRQFMQELINAQPPTGEHFILRAGTDGRYINTEPAPHPDDDDESWRYYNFIHECATWRENMSAEVPHDAVFGYCIAAPDIGEPNREEINYDDIRTDMLWIEPAALDALKQAYRTAFAWLDRPEITSVAAPHPGPVPAPAPAPVGPVTYRLPLPVPAGQVPRYLNLSDNETLTTSTFQELLDEAAAAGHPLRIIEAHTRPGGVDFYRAFDGEAFIGHVHAHYHGVDVGLFGVERAREPGWRGAPLDPISRQRIQDYIVYDINRAPNGIFTVQRLQNAQVEENPDVRPENTYRLVIDETVAETTHPHPEAIAAEREAPRPEVEVPVAIHSAVAAAWWRTPVQGTLEERKRDKASDFYISTRRADPINAIALIDNAVASKLHLGFYDARGYQFDRRLALIDYDPALLPLALQQLVHDRLGFDMVADRADIEFDASVWRLKQYNAHNVEVQIDNLPHNIIAQGLVARWTNRQWGAFNAVITAGITGDNGVTTGGIAQAMPSQLAERNLAVSFDSSRIVRHYDADIPDDIQSLNPDNGRWRLEPGRTVGSFWVIVVYDPAQDNSLPNYDRPHIHKKVSISFVVVLKNSPENIMPLAQLSKNIGAANNAANVFDALIQYENNAHGQSAADTATLHAAIDIMQGPEHAIIAIPAEFMPPPPVVVPPPAHPDWGAGEDVWRPFFAGIPLANREPIIALAPVFRQAQLRAWALPVVVPPAPTIPPGSGTPPPAVVPPPAPGSTTSPAPGSHVPPAPTTPPGSGTPPPAVVPPPAPTTSPATGTPPPPHVPAKVLTQTEKLRKQASALQVRITVINKQIKQLNAQIAKTQKQLTQATKIRDKKKINAFKNTLAQLKKSLTKMQKNLAQVKKQSRNAQVKLKQLGVDVKINAQRLVVKKRQVEVTVAKKVVSQATSAKKKLDAQLKGKKLTPMQRSTQTKTTKNLANAKKVLAGKEKQLRAAQVAQRKLEQEKKNIK